MTVQGVQNCGLPFSIYALWGAPIFSLRALKIFCDFLYDCIFIMIWLKKRFPSHFRLRYFVLFPAFVLRHFLSHACAAASRISFSGAFSPGKYPWTWPIFLACNGLAPLQENHSRNSFESRNWMCEIYQGTCSPSLLFQSVLWQDRIRMRISPLTHRRSVALYEPHFLSSFRTADWDWHFPSGSQILVEKAL